ncbi:MAG TPA: IPT/TIG domain-containing protein [Nitrospira sp.]|nr:IPT/TIG domain-containing protein [Nitrospira sp.]
MVKRMGSTTMVLIGAVALVLAAGDPGQTLAADKDKPAKKPKAAPEAKAPKPKADKSKFKTAETASKAKACFGEAPKIEKLTPDEGKAGDKVTITGMKFGSADCLRGVSFGPGHAATFTMKNEATITATVPSGGRKGLAMVTVTTASGEDSKAFLVK